MGRLLYEDKIWVSFDRKLRGIFDDVTLARADGRNVLVIAHFENTLSVVEATLRGESIDCHTYFPGDDGALCAKGLDTKMVKVRLALAAYFQGRNARAVAEAGKEKICILFAEHHPMATRDQSLLEAVTRLPCQSSMTFHTALTESLMTHFGGEKLQGLLKQMGHEEDTYLSHPLVSTAIRRAQEKIDKQVQREIRAQSEEEWFKYNIGNRG